MLIGMVGPHPTVLPEETLIGCNALDFVTRGEFDFTIADIANESPLCDVEGISYRNRKGIIHNANRRPVEDMDRLPSVLDVYQRDLHIEKYFIGYLLHPYLSLYTGRGCPGRCTFCLWPQTIGGHNYRTRSVQSVIDEMKRAKHMFPQVREFFFDDDTFTAKPSRAEAIAGGLKKLGIIWSCSTRANVPEKSLEIMKDGGLRGVMVGIESSQIRTFMKACRKLDIVVHATFMVGLPGETRDTIRQTIQFAKEIDPDTLQVSVAAPYPGTEFYRQAVENGWLIDSDLFSSAGVQQVSLKYSHLTGREIFDAVEALYRQFYFRPKPIIRILLTMLTDKDICARRLREAREFFSFMKNRKKSL